jgi:hypothetical protein
VLDSPLLTFAYLAEVLAQQSRFAPVQAGEIVSTGSLTDLLPVTPGETWSTTLDGISLPGLVSLARVVRAPEADHSRDGPEHWRSPSRHLPEKDLQ